MRTRVLALSLLISTLAASAPAQSPCAGADTCPGVVAQMVCPAPGTTLPGNDVTFTWCNANADYFLDIESLPGAHNIFYALVSSQNFVRLINVPTNGATIYVTLWTKLHGQWQTPLQYTYSATNAFPLQLTPPKFGTNGQCQLVISGLSPGKTNVVQCSANLCNWTSIATNVAVGNSIQVSDPAAVNLNARFYRVFELR